MPEELEREQTTRSRPVVGVVRPVHAGGVKLRTALASGIVGMATIVLLILIFPLVIGLANTFNLGSMALVVWYILTGIALISSITAIALAIRSRFQSNWAVTGLVLGIIDLLWSSGFLVLGMFL